MTLRFGCIADDRSGASDLAKTLTRQRLRTVQTIDVRLDVECRKIAQDVAVPYAVRAFGDGM